MNESSGKVDIPADVVSDVSKKVLEAAGVTCIGASGLPDNETLHRFSARTISGRTHVLVTVKVPADGQASVVTVNCEKMVISSMLVKEIKLALQ